MTGTLTAVNAPISGTPTPFPGGSSVSGETDKSPVLPRLSARSSDPDLTTATKLDPSFVHLVPGTLVDEYEVEKLLGAGGMGAVYGATHRLLGRRVAIKVISPTLSRDHDAVERFEQEAHALARISHPNIVGVLNVGTLPGDGREYFVMEWLDGESLHARLDRRAIEFELALHVIDQIARGLEVAHAAGIVHRDLKPDNVWLHHVGDEPRPVVKILDFGLAKVMQSGRSEQTANNLMFGTSAYMSPEQCRSARDVGPATDVYALGCVAYELLFARLPFTYDNMAELVAAHLLEEPPRPASLDPSIDPSLDALLSAMLAKEPSERPTLAHVRYVIANALASSRRAYAQQHVGRPATFAPASTVVTQQPSRRVLMAFAGLVLLAAITAAAVGGSDTGRLERPRHTTESSSAPVVDITVAPIESPPPSAARTERAPAVVRSTVTAEPIPAPRDVTSTAHPRPNIERRPAVVRRVPPRVTPQTKAPKRPDVVESDSRPRDPDIQRAPSRKVTSRYETLNPFKKK